MNPRVLLTIVVLIHCAGCASLFGPGHAAEFRAEYEQLKAAILAAPDAPSEDGAMRDLGQWFKARPYGYTLRAAGQPNANGIHLDRLQPGESVTLDLHMRADSEPRPGGFTFVPKDKENL